MNRGKIFIILLLSIMTPAMIVCAGETTVQKQGGTFTITIPADSYRIEETGDGAQIEADGFGRLQQPGKPSLPSKIFPVAIPPGSEVVDVTFEPSRSFVLDNNFRIAPARLPAVINGENPLVRREERELFEKNYNSVYFSDEPFPSSMVEVVRNAKYRKYDLVDLRVCPFTYYPLSGTIVHYPEMSITVRYAFPEGMTAAEPQAADSERTERLAQEFIYNYRQSQQWYPVKTKTRETFDFVVITLEDLVDSITPLVEWEALKGRNVYIATTAWISSSYSGYDLAEKMRNFLRDKYPSGEWGIEDVLLVGHYDDVPMRRCYQDVGYGMPETDYYYAELSLPDDLSWDADQDRRWGEDEDPIDFYAEVNVGRIPWSAPATVTHICEKTAAYEQNNDPSFKKNILLLGAFFWPDTDNAELMEYKSDPVIHPWMEEWTTTKMYEQGYSSFPMDYNLSYSNVRTVWSGGSYAFVNWAGHGSPTACYEYYPSQAFVDTWTCSHLNDDYPSIIFADACSNSDTDYLNIGQEMLRQGGVGFLGATKVAYGMPGWNDPYDGSSQSLDYFFTSSVTSADYTMGEGHQRALREMYTNGLWYYTKYEMFEWGALWGNPDIAMGFGLRISFPDGLPDMVRPGVPTPIALEIDAVLDRYIEGSGLLHYRFDGGEYLTAPIEAAGDDYVATLPPAHCGDTPEFYFSIEGELSGVVLSPADAPATVYSAIVGELFPVFTDDFEEDLGWTVEDDPYITAGSWERGIPVGGGDRGDPATDYDGSGNCYLTDNRDGDSDVDGGITWLTSPVMNLTGGLDAKIEYAVWYTNNFGNDPNNDYFYVHVSNDDGATWVEADVIGPSTSSGWKVRSFMAGDFVTRTNRMRVRFEVSDLNEGSVVEAGLDAFTAYIFDCQEGEIVVDNAGPYFAVLSGAWNTADHENAWLGDCMFTAGGSGGCRAGWGFDQLIEPGEFEVFVWKFEHEHQHLVASDAKYRVYHENGVSDWIEVDQTTPGNEWISIGTYAFVTSRTQGVLFNNNANGYVIADAVKLVEQTR